MEMTLVLLVLAALCIVMLVLYKLFR